MPKEVSWQYLCTLIKGVKVIINESDITDIQAEITGPAGTPYEGGIYRCKLAVEGDFPESAPKGIFYIMARLFHDQNIPSQCVLKGWDLRKFSQERLGP